jgi:ABC-2 type transport system ATP-binding protein
MIKIENLKKTYKNNIVFDNINLTINNGELIYIHGVNGSGKSTLFKIISGIIEQDGGKVIKDSDTHIGALIENPGFLENDTIKSNLKFLASLKNNYNETKIEELCNLLNLDYNNKAKIKNYSLGMRQKAGIIQAVMENQNYILLDEPTRGLDNSSIQSFIQLIKQLHNEGKTIVIASHDYISELSYDKHYYLDNGLLKEE